MKYLKLAMDLLTEKYEGMQVVNKDTIVIDGRGKSRDAIRKIANKHFFGSESGIERDEGRRDRYGRRGDSGYLIVGNLIHYANVASVQDGIIVASKKDLGPKETRPLAKKFVTTLSDTKS